MSVLYVCVGCGCGVTLVPTLKERGMTRAEALFLFRDSYGGRCTECFLAKRSAESVELMRRIA